MTKASMRSHRFVIIGLVACSMLMHEILLTRVCALRLYFHFAFLVISSCLLGLGASGSLLATYQNSWKQAPRLWLGRFSIAYAISLVFAYALVLRYPLPQSLDFANPGDLVALSLFNLGGALPFVFGGAVVGMLLTFDVTDVNRLYAVDLLGAGAGCIAVPFLLPHVGAGGVFVLTVVLAVVASAVAVHDRYPRAALGVAAALFVVGAVLLPRFDRMYPVPSKGLVDFALAVDHSNYQEPFSIWTANSRIDLLRGAKDAPRVYAKVFTQGSNTVGLPLTPHAAGIAQDATAGTTMLDYSEEPEGFELLRRAMYSAAYRLKESPRVFIIGLGGGNDAWAAKLNNARSVKAVELNWPIVALHQKVMRDFSRNLVEDPHVELVVGEGRSALMRDTNHYDVIQMTGIDTWTALASGAYVLAENYLYTSEAIESMYSHLAPGGILQISRFAEAMEALRMISNMHAALEHLGAADHFEDSVQALATEDKIMAIQLKKGPFTREEQDSTEKYANEAGIRVVYQPKEVREGPVDRFIREPDKQKLIDAFPMNISPTVDDKPYFFNYARWQHPIASVQRIDDIPSASQGNPMLILSQFFVSIVLSALLIVYPIARRSDVPKKGKGRYFVYFAGLGLGFIFIEVGAIQKLTLFLGQPVYSLTVTLFSLLVFTGLGSLLFAGRLSPGDRRIWAVPLGIAVFIAIFLGGSSLFVSHLIGLPVGVRIALAVLLLCPIGLLLGVPFAYGLRVVADYHPSLTSWAWAINGSVSVVGSILTVIVSMNFGFTAVMCAAVLVYLVAFTALMGAPRAAVG
ncbi:MAG TPA: hypothetical protein VH062_36820 [Polyangiaceae bacterium]|jgi:spermidine synthase|nr:hypothetical protein [Polyangiaceae bacterium]